MMEISRLYCRTIGIWLGLLFLGAPLWAQGTGTITTIAGTTRGFSGDGGLATEAKLNHPRGVFVDGADNVFITDKWNHRVRKVNGTTGIITTVAGSGIPGPPVGDGGPATAAHLFFPDNSWVDGSGNIFIADDDNNLVRKVSGATGIITSIAGTGQGTYGGDGGPATAAKIDNPEDIALDAAGNLYIADRDNSRIRKVNGTTGIITTFAGTGTGGFNGDGGQAASAQVNAPRGVAIDGAGHLFIADTYNHRIRRVDAATGIITTVAGDGIQGFGGDQGPAIQAQLDNPFGVAVDSEGNLYVADTNNRRIRRVDAATGIITTVVGGSATEVQLSFVEGVCVDDVDNLYVADGGNHRILKVDFSVPPVVQEEVAAPDTVVAYAQVVEIPVRVGDTTGKDIVSAEVFVAYDGDLLTATGVDATGTLLIGDWSVETNIVKGNSTNIDTIKIAMATDEDVLVGVGTLINIDFQVADIRHPASSSLTLTHVLLNDGDPEAVSTDGSVTLVGVDGSITSLPSEILPRWSVGVSVYDVDEDRDTGTRDAFAVAVTNGSQTEMLMMMETSISTGIFSGVIGTEFSLSFTSDDGIIQAKAGDQIVFSYADSLDSNGDTEERTDVTDVLGGTDGLIRATVVSQPGDTVRVRVSDADLINAVAVGVTNPRTGETESIVLSQFTSGESYFYGRFFTETQAGAVGDSTLQVAKGDTLSITYQDTLTADGGTAVVVDDDEVVDPFGDAHPNGSVQAFDAAQVLVHRLSTYGGGVGTLSGLDSLSANVDQAAPFGILDGYDASLILRKVVGLIDRFEVQEADAVNQPQPETAARPKAVPEERWLSLRIAEDHVSVWADERDGIVSGEVTLEGLAGQVVMGEELTDFLSVSREQRDGVRVVFAGSESVDGPGELLRVYGVGSEHARLIRVRLNGGRLGVRTEEEVSTVAPLRFALLGNAPNPFNPETAIRFVLAEEGWVGLTVYDVLGQRVRTLVAASLPTGAQRVVWDGRDEAGVLVSSGVYFYRLQAGERFAPMQRMMLLK